MVSLWSYRDGPWRQCPKDQEHWFLMSRVDDGDLNGGTGVDNLSSSWPELAPKDGDQKTMGRSPTTIPATTLVELGGIRSAMKWRSWRWLGWLQRRSRQWRMVVAHKWRPWAKHQLLPPISSEQCGPRMVNSSGLVASTMVNRPAIMIRRVTAYQRCMDDQKTLTTHSWGEGKIRRLMEEGQNGNFSILSARWHPWMCISAQLSENR